MYKHVWSKNILLCFLDPCLYEKFPFFNRRYHIVASFSKQLEFSCKLLITSIYHYLLIKVKQSKFICIFCNKRCITM